MLKLEKIDQDCGSHEEIFLARYGRLRVWALRLADDDRGRAEDLVHDAFVQFTFARPALREIQNIDGYLYAMLRNLNLAQVRRAARLQSRALSIVDYDAAEVGLRAVDPRDQIRLQDELRQVIRYACMRKETSKAGSVLLLRFLHGYYPREIARVMRGSRQSVEERLRVARSEAKLYLENPKALRFMREADAGGSPVISQTSFAPTADDLLRELRHATFQSRRGECLTGERLESIYGEDERNGVDAATLAHVVSCRDCLDAVNRLLDLPPLAERCPTDTLGTDARPKGGDDGGDDDDPPPGAASDEESRRCRRRAREVFEHRPQELCVAVNGRLVARQKIGGESSEQTLNLSVTERIDFVEVVSEQEVRLLFFGIGESPAHPSQKLSSVVRLSDDRTLEANLNFDDAQLRIGVVYHDPSMRAESAATVEAAEGKRAVAEASRVEDRRGEREGATDGKQKGRGFLSVLERLWRSFVSRGFWLRPGTATAAFAVILIAVMLLARMHFRETSAATLLRRSTLAAESVLGNADTAVHRAINLEERSADEGYLIARRRIEVWQSAGGGEMRRVYDERGNLLAGERITPGGATSTLYRRELPPQTRVVQAGRARALFEGGDIWRLDSSAKDFSALVGEVDKVTVEEKSGAYVLTYKGDGTGGAPKLLRATLTLDRNDLRALEQTLVVQPDEGSGARVYKFTVSRYEKLPARGVAPSVFQPDAELLDHAEPGAGESQRAKDDAPSSAASSFGAPPATTAKASPELEIEVAYLLNEIKANLGEQVSVARTADGALRVEAIVETEARKAEILRALAPVANNPAVVVAVSTVAEASARLGERATGGQATEREVEVTTGGIPADAELRRYFSARLSGGDAVDKEIARLARRVMNRSRAALLHASALKRLVERFSAEEMRALTPQARAKWTAMIREHARSYGREANALRQDLRPVFPAPASGEAARESVNEANVVQSAGRLLQLSYEQDAAVRSAFTVSADGRQEAAVKSPHFWRSLETAERLAAGIDGVYQK